MNFLFELKMVVNTGGGELLIESCCNATVVMDDMLALLSVTVKIVATVVLS